MSDDMVQVRGVWRPRPSDNTSRPRARAGYMKDEQSSFFQSWIPYARDPRQDIRMAYTRAAGRAVDALQNSGWIAGAVEQSIASMIGNGLRLAAKPDADALGWTPEYTSAWTRRVERRFEDWAGCPMEVDAAGKQNLGELTASVVRSWYGYGEALGLLPLVDRQWSETRTKVKLLPPHWLMQDSDGAYLFQGVWHDHWDLPVAYRINLIQGVAFQAPVDVPARDAAGRPQVMHIFDCQPGAVRGITPMAPVLKVVRQYDQLADATLTTSLLQAIFAATIQSDAPTQDLLAGLQDQDEQGVAGGSIEDLVSTSASFNEHINLDLGRFGKIAHLFPGEKLEFHGSKQPNSTYEPFAKFLLREVARCLGMTFETLTGDFTGATYSSVRMATSEIWPIILKRRFIIGGRFCQMVYESWLEEEIDAGRQEFPGGLYAFVAQRRAACRADWRGPAKPTADDLKAAKAYEVLKAMGVISDEQICSELGWDWEDLYEQLAREMETRKSLGLPESLPAAAAAEEKLAEKLISSTS